MDDTANLADGDVKLASQRWVGHATKGMQPADFQDFRWRELGLGVVAAAWSQARIAARCAALTRRAPSLGYTVGNVLRRGAYEQMAESRQQNAVQFVGARVVVTDALRGVARMGHMVAPRRPFATRQSPRDFVRAAIRPRSAEGAVSILEAASRPQPATSERAFGNFSPEACAEFGCIIGEQGSLRSRAAPRMVDAMPRLLLPRIIPQWANSGAMP